MRVKVRLYTILRKYREGKIDPDGSVQLPVHSSIQELAAYLRLPAKPGKIYLVNDVPRDENHTLHQGDEVKILSFIGGG